MKKPLLLLLLVFDTGQADLQFSEVSVDAGASYSHALTGGIQGPDDAESGGVAAGDYNNDGHTDLYIVTGDSSDNVLLRNTGLGNFINETSGSGVALSGHWSSGPVFADINGDGWQDLLVGSMHGEGYYVFTNDQDGTFTDTSSSANVDQQFSSQNDITSSLGDIDNDGDLDLFVGHHRFIVSGDRNHLWVNDGSGVFSAGDTGTGITVFGGFDMSFAATFVDLNHDGWQDILISADNNQSQIYQNDGDGTFSLTTDEEVITDQNGMGSAAADFDNDGDIDWFVTSIYEAPGTFRTGNRLYINDGNGVFFEDSSNAGVRDGAWGWGACAADFDNDGWLDIFHVNGMHSSSGVTEDHDNDASRLFLNNQDDTFTESAAAFGIVDTTQGRGLVCFDYDHDGDIDIFVFVVDGPTQLFRNNLTDNPGWLQVDVAPEESGKTTAGTVIEIDIGTLTQTRQLTIGSNFESQNPLRQHFGLGGSVIIDELRVTWPSGSQIVMQDVDINQLLLVKLIPPEPPIYENGFE